MKPIILIKTGGRVAIQGPELTALVSEIKELKTTYSFIIIHGGGSELTEASKIYDYTTTFVHGVRMTTPPEMDLADGILAGKVNKRLVRTFESMGIKSVGLSGNDGRIFTGRTKDLSKDNRTGVVTKTDPSLLTLLIDGGYTPIVSSVSMEECGEALNINADEVALALSEALTVEKVIFISDIPGILKDNRVLGKITPPLIEEEIKSGVICGGMIPKVNASITALNNGVESVVISNYLEDGDLKQLIDNKKGSIITLKKESL